jgi:predicted transcriptional regulator
MIANTLIDANIPFLKKTDKPSEALDLMEEHYYKELPLVDNEFFIGYLSQEALLNKTKISEIEPNSTDIKAYEQAHIFEVMHMMYINDKEIIAVVDKDNIYKGAVKKENIANYFIAQDFVNTLGGILVLEVSQINYSLSEISRIVESNDMKIISTFTQTDVEEPSLLLITLKLNKDDLTRLIASFERYGYKIVAEFHESEIKKIDTERYEQLMRFLNI